MKTDIDPELEPWARSMETDILLCCPVPECSYLFGDTLSITSRSTKGELTCRRCGAMLDWEKQFTVTYKTKLKQL